ncbi:MFS transporter [Allorhizobium sp. BGMRC 0089]|uniref:MFS transporter n=1 Tax=Allorhizobium sonneratiae TaxID=2934936 RepID=UPI002033D181|nr:MFS transporter [Allorhizobium sonneratiae]MCM2292903.1 MFS transporter [Allorhizobium sonneratiae]
MKRHHRPFFALTAAELLSISGTRLSALAIPWLVLSVTGSPVWTGLAGLVEMLPYVLAKALAGPLIDRMGARRIALVCDGMSAFAAAMIPVLQLFHLLTMASLLPVVFILGCFRGPSDAAKQAMVPDVAEQGGLPLERVTGVIASVERLASTFGAAVAGALIAAFGPGPALFVNAVTFLLALLIVSTFIPVVSRNTVLPPEKRAAYLGAFREGWRFLRGDVVLRATVLMVAMTNLLDQAFQAVLLPVWIRQSGYGPEMMGAMLAFFMGASLLGAAMAAVMGEKMPRLAVYTVAFLLAGLPRFLIFAVNAPVLALYAVLGISGFASGFLNPILAAILFERIPKRLLGRVTSLNAALCWSLIPFGGLVGGLLTDGVGVDAALFVVGLVYLAVTLSPLFLRGFREIERRPAP